MISSCIIITVILVYSKDNYKFYQYVNYNIFIIVNIFINNTFITYAN